MTESSMPEPSMSAVRRTQRMPGPHDWSLRARLIAVVAVLLTVSLAAAGLLTAAVLHTELTGQVDRQLLGSLGDPRHDVEHGHSGPDRGPTYFNALRLDDGTVVYSQVSGTDDAPPDLPVLTGAQAADKHEPFTVTAPDGRRWRMVVRAARQQSTQQIIGTYYAAMPLADNESTLSSVLIRFAVLAVGLIALMMLVGFLAIGRAFRPLREVESVATAFGRGDTSRRVTGARPGTEVGRLGTSVNEMLDEIETTLAVREASEQRMRRFVGDASHELRTPLSTLRGYAELYRMGAVTGEDNISGTFRRIEDESTRMQALVEDLLRLARLDEQRPLRLTSVDLLVLASDAEHDAVALAPDRQVRIRGLDGHPEPGSALVTGDEQQLRQVVTNLMANAIRHTPAGSAIELGVGTRGDFAVVQVVDHGAGVPPELADKIFERFYRADASRARSSGGSGLGLAIVAAIMAVHHGDARVLATPGGGATFEVRLPVRRPLPATSQKGPRPDPVPHA